MKQAGQDDLVTAIEAVYAAGLDSARWPQALEAIAGTVGGVAATLEVFDRTPLHLKEFHSFGLPPANELAYLDHVAALNPRIPALVNGAPGGLVTDYSVMDENSMNRDEFYSDFLAPVGYRYFIGGILAVGSGQSTLFSVQRATRQGHVGNYQMDTMRRLLPHMQQACDLAARLKGADPFAGALDWLSDGAALLRADGHVLYANAALRAITRRGDGVRITRGAVEFTQARACASLAAALGGFARRAAGDPHAVGQTDFPVPRASAPAYVVSIRPLPGAAAGRPHQAAVAVLFVRDPLDRNIAAARMLRDLFGLTPAEASLALAIQAGQALPDYARRSRVSLNTIYTHLRRLKEKTGCRRISSLGMLLRQLQVPLREA